VIGVGAVLVALAFGAADQYLGSLSAQPWANEVSLLSAPWLLLAFVAGWTQREPKRAAELGLACTIASIVGYGLMTLSPVENAQLTPQSIAAFVVSESAVIAGGLFTGPLFGWFGYLWRDRRAWAGAVLAGAAITLEPLAHSIAGNPISIRTVWLAEVAAGVAMIIYIAVQACIGTTRGHAS
jgi:hypothetical protein